VLRWLLEVWKAYAHRAATYQTGVLLMLVYALALGPAALIARAFGARLVDLRAGSATTWLARANTSEDRTLGALRRQF
jgi:hypothetical protein